MVGSLRRFVCATLLAFAAPLVAQAPAGPVGRAVRAAAPPRLDGVLDDALWRTAAPLDGFRQVEPVTGAAPTAPTEARVAFDDRYVYVAIRADAPPDGAAPSVRTMRRDFDETTSEYVAVVLGQSGDLGTGFVFAVNPDGAKRDLQFLDGGLQDVEWNGLWRAAAKRTATGWSAEYAIPWSALRYKADGTEWRFNVYRNVIDRQELIAWAPWPRGLQPTRLEFAGRLLDLEPPPSRPRLRLQPYALRRTRTDRIAGLRDEATDVGIDAKLAITPGSVADLTLHPDFGQTDVDRQQVNVSRFGIVFPERRPFFLEHRGIFQVTPKDERIQPFFSRRLGLADDGTIVPITAGARLVSRSRGRTFGALAVEQEDDLHARSRFGMVRGVLPFGRARSGLMFVRREDRAPDGTIRRNDVFSFDHFVRLSSIFSAQANFFASRDAAGATKAETGLGAYLSLAGHSSRYHFLAEQEVIGDGLRLRSGYVPSADLLRSNIDAYLDLRPSWLPRPIRQMTPGIAGTWSLTASGHAPVERWLLLRPLDIVWQNGARLILQTSVNRQDVATAYDQVPGVRVDRGRYDYWRLGMIVNTSPAKPLYARVVTTLGSWYGGTLRTAILSLAWAADPRLVFANDVTWFGFRRIGTSRSSRDTWLVIPEARVALNPRVQLSLLGQWNSSIRQASVNGRLSWEFAPLSFLTVVYNGADPLDGRAALGLPPVRQRQWLAKATYVVQF